VSPAGNPGPSTGDEPEVSHMTLQERIDFYVDVCDMSPQDAKALADFEYNPRCLDPAVIDKGPSR
jgi:hypothetical protein